MGTYIFICVVTVVLMGCSTGNADGERDTSDPPSMEVEDDLMNDALEIVQMVNGWCEEGKEEDDLDISERKFLKGVDEYDDLTPPEKVIRHKRNCLYHLTTLAIVTRYQT